MKNNSELHYVALAFLAEHQGEHLSHDERTLLVERCIDNLMEVGAVSKQTAEIIALQAYGERDSRRCRAYVDLNLSTSFTIFVRDPSNSRTRVFTVAELIALCRTPALSSLPVPSAKDLLANGIAADSKPL